MESDNAPAPSTRSESWHERIYEGVGAVCRLILKFVAWSIVATLLFLLGLWIVSMTNTRIGFRVRYDLDDSQVFMDRKPHDCEWGSAPIGNKNCHYEIVVSPELDRSHNGEEPLTFPENLSGNNVKSVTVTWNKVQD